MFKLKPNKSVEGKFFVKGAILQFDAQHRFISDEDINDLFLGLVELIKKNVSIQIEHKYMSEIDSLKVQLNRIKNKE